MRRRILSFNQPKPWCACGINWGRGPQSSMVEMALAQNPQAKLWVFSEAGHFYHAFLKGRFQSDPICKLSQAALCWCCNLSNLFAPANSQWHQCCPDSDLGTKLCFGICRARKDTEPSLPVALGQKTSKSLVNSFLIQQKKSYKATCFQKCFWRAGLQDVFYAWWLDIVYLFGNLSCYDAQRKLEDQYRVSIQ